MAIIVARISEQARIPTREPDSVGYDVYAYGAHILSPGETKIIPLGFNLILPENHAAFMWDRSSFGSKGIHIAKEMIVNTNFELEMFDVVPFGGVLDWSYRGQCGAILHSFLRTAFEIPHGTKIAQFVVQECVIAEIEEITMEEYVSEKYQTLRGTAGYGCSDGQNTPESAQQQIMGGEVVGAENDLAKKEESFWLKKD